MRKRDTLTTTTTTQRQQTIMMSRNSGNHTANAYRTRNIGDVEVSRSQQQQKKKRKRKKNDNDDDDDNNIVVVAGGSGGSGSNIRIDNNTSHSISLYSDRVRCACEACNSNEQNYYRNASNGSVDIERHVPSTTALLAPTINGDRSIVVDHFDGEIDFLRSQTVNNCGPATAGGRDGAHRFAIYENLCEFCGFAIGTGSYHQNCLIGRRGVRANGNVTRDNNNSANSAQLEADNSFSENIYENICKSCHLIYSGDQCVHCECENETPAVPAPPPPPSQTATTKVKTIGAWNDELTASKPKQLTRQFSDLFGSLKQKFKERKAPAPPPTNNGRNRRIEIVHSSDHQVFKTNQTFDLNEIVQLKLQQQQRDQHIYGKLRKESCVTTTAPHQPNSTRLVRSSASESNFFDCQFGRDHQLPFHLSPYSESIVSDTCLYGGNSYAAPPSYEDAIHNSLYTSVCIDSASHSSSSALSLLTPHERVSESQSIAAAVAAVGKLLVNNASLKHWMTSLRRQTYDYGGSDNDRLLFDCATVKCVPSKLVNATNGDAGVAANDDGALSAELRERIAVFQVNVVQRMQSKQTIAHCSECGVASSEQTHTDEGPEATIGNSEIEWNTTAAATTTSKIEIENVERACAVTNAPDSGFGELSTTIHTYLQSVKTFYIAQITLSTSLNRSVLVCGDKKFHYLIKLLCSSDYGDPLIERQCMRRIHLPTKYTNLNSLLIALHEMSAQRPQLAVAGDDGNDNDVVDATGHRSPKSKFNDFLMATASGSAIKRFEDFDKTHRDACGRPKKTLNDFVMKKSHSSSSVTASASDDVHAAAQESIYQPIWMFNTIGHASSESALHELDDECGDAGGDGIDDGSEWEEVTEEEFLFSNDRFNSTTMNHALSMDNNVSGEKLPATDSLPCYPYQSVCILYSVDDAKYNKIIYDYNGNNSICVSANANECDGTDSIGACSLSGSNTELLAESESRNCKVVDSTRQAHAIDVRFDSVDAWKAMLSGSHFLEDEEDLILSESFLLNKRPIEQPLNVLKMNGTNATTIEADRLSTATTKNSVQTEKTEETEVSSTASIVSSRTTPSPTPVTVAVVGETKAKRDLGFLNKLQYRRFDITKNSTKKDDVVQGLFYKNLNGKTYKEASPPMEIKKISATGNLVYGVELDDVEKDDKFTDIPKFVVECIKIIEMEENIRTNGIYRASGKKDSIDKLRKKMNESKLRRGTKYVSLKDEDIHTVTGALKQFFRELKTDLIPIEIVKNLPNDLENEENLDQIKYQMSTIDYLPREVLKYLLKHLIRVDQNREHNLMNATNLSIVWGACIFTSSVSITDTFETSDLMKKNTLFKVLIQRYDDLFVDVDRLI